MSNSIRFDPAIFSDTFSSIQISGKKGERLGYYQKGNSYHFTTEALHQQKSPLITDINKIATVLHQEKLGVVVFDETTKSIRCLEYLNRLNKIVITHNERLQKSQGKGVLRLLLAIPIICRIVKWFFAPVPQPLNIARGITAVALRQNLLQSDNATKIDAFIKKKNFLSLEEIEYLSRLQKLRPIIKKEKDLIQYCFGGDKEALLKIKKDLLEELEKIKAHYGELEDAEVWSEIEKNIQAAYEAKAGQQQAEKLPEPTTEKPAEVNLEQEQADTASKGKKNIQAADEPTVEQQQAEKLTEHTTGPAEVDLEQDEPGTASKAEKNIQAADKPVEQLVAEKLTEPTTEPTAHPRKRL